MENNSKASRIKRTKHIDITYFFITNRVKNGEVSVLWCPTVGTIGNYITKPLQGDMFNNFVDQIMVGIQDSDPFPGKDKVEQLRKT